MLPDACRDELFDAINSTNDNARMTLTLALSYSGRSEIVRAARALAERVASGDIEIEAIDQSLFASTLDTQGMPDPDLLIRTGGEYRVSNFLLWQLAYTEMYITDEFWPAFRRDQLYQAVRDYQSRDRRFGRV
jgi:undecaprenyl diphosphate synthase